MAWVERCIVAAADGRVGGAGAAMEAAGSVDVGGRLLGTNSFVEGT